MKYTKEHEWARLDNDGMLIVGITEYAVEQIGDVTLVDLAPEGTKLQANDNFGDIESVKAVSELFSPVSGEIVEINEALQDAPELVNDAPLSDGWMIRMKMDDPSELDGLMTLEEYNEFTDSEG